MNTNHDLYLDLCAALAAGSIGPEDRRVLEEHLDTGCAECLAFLRDLSGPIEALARSVPAAKPSRGLKARVMVAVAQTRRPLPGGPGAPASPHDVDHDHRLPIWVWVALVALALAAAFGWWRASQTGTREDAPDERRDAPRPSDAIRYEAFVAGHPKAKPIKLDRTPDAPPEVEVEVVYDEAGRRAAVRVVRGGPPEGKALELWTIRGGKPHSEGLFSRDGFAFVENTGPRAGLSHFAVSVEPPEGAKDRETPTTVALIKQL